MQQQLGLSSSRLCSGTSVPRVLPREQSVRVQAVSETSPAFKVPTSPLPKDPQGVHDMIAKSHQMHGQGRSLWFCLTGPGKRATVGTYLAHADNLDWNAAASGSVDSYNIFS